LDKHFVQTLTLQLFDDIDVEAQDERDVSFGAHAGGEVIVQTSDNLKIHHVLAGGDVRLQASLTSASDPDDNIDGGSITGDGTIAGDTADPASDTAIGTLGNLTLLADGSIGTEDDPLRLQVAPAGLLSLNVTGQAYLHQLADTTLNVSYFDNTPDTTAFNPATRGFSVTTAEIEQFGYVINAATMHLPEVIQIDLAPIAISHLRVENALVGGDLVIHVIDETGPSNVGDLIVGKIVGHSSVDLRAAHSILDLFSDADAPIVNVLTDGLNAPGHVYLEAGEDIGTAGNFFDVTISGDLTGQLGDDAFIHSMGDLRIGVGPAVADGRFESLDGNVTLDVAGTAVVGLIVALGDTTLDSATGLTDGVVKITASQYIFDRRDDLLPSIQATGAVLIAGLGVGSSTDPFETDVRRLEAAIEGGGIWLDNYGDFQIGNISSLVVGVSALGEINLSAKSTMTVNEDIVSVLGPILLDASHDIVVNAGITSGGANLIRLTADQDLVGGGGITMFNGSYIDATNGFVDLNATGNIILSHVRTTAQVDVDTTTGAILDSTLGGPDTDLEIVASAAQLTASGNIGIDADELEVDVSFLEGSSASGGIYIDDENGIVIGTIGLVPLLQNTLLTGVKARQSIRVTTTGFMRVKENVESEDADVTLHTIDSAVMTVLPQPNGSAAVSALDLSDADEDLIVESNSTIKAETTITLLAGDDLFLQQGSTLTTDDTPANSDEVTDRIVVRVDHGNADTNAGFDSQGNAYDTGARLDLFGGVATTTFEITGEDDDDTFHLSPATLRGHTQAFGDRSAVGAATGGSDLFVLDHLPSVTSSHDRPGHLLANGSNGVVLDTIDLDGRSGTDHYVVNISGDATAYLVNVHDTGLPDDGADTLRVHTLQEVGPAPFDWDHPQQGVADAGTDDVFLLRRNFVAYLTDSGNDDSLGRPIFEQQVERINYDWAVNGRLLVSSGAGDDEFYVDDNSAITTLDGGQGADLFQIGQVF
ncbi:MAG TPA: hypothetical protein VLI71_13960, partial [Gammaproteobacteria bacterium]|nr:hypothetical protein [Gammaproteobacteria bacterium]